MLLKIKNDAGEWISVPAVMGVPGSGLPSYTEDDNGKILSVVNGEMAWVTDLITEEESEESTEEVTS